MDAQESVRRSKCRTEWFVPAVPVYPRENRVGGEPSSRGIELRDRSLSVRHAGRDSPRDAADPVAGIHVFSCGL